MEEKFRFDDGAQKDIREAFEWHESQSNGRGDKFLQALKYKLMQIEKKPESFSKFESEIRKTALKGFPYFIFYTTTPPFILVIAVWHFSRNRLGWKNRLK